MQRSAVLQLKRFQHTSFVRRKLGTLITFPLSGLDFGAYLARAQPAAAGAQRREASEHGAASAAPEDVHRANSVVPPLSIQSVDGTPVLLSRKERELYDLYA